MSTGMLLDYFNPFRSTPKKDVSERPPPRHSTGHQDDSQDINMLVATDVKQELLHDGSCVSVQHDISPTIGTDCQDVETSKSAVHHHLKSDQKAREKESWYRKKMHKLEDKITEEIKYSKRLEAMLEDQERELRQTKAKLTNIEETENRRIQELLAIQQRQNDEIKLAKEELRNVKTKYQQTNQLLQQRSEELSTAQQFLGKADSISLAEVAGLVEILNAEIAQLCNLILDSLTYQKWPGDTKELERLLEGLHGLLDPWLYDKLWHRLNDPNLDFDNLLLTQLALQTGIINTCTFIINDWNPPFWNDGPIVDYIYDNMGKKVGQVVAGKWRALSSTYLGVNHDANKEFLRGIVLKLITAVGDPGPLKSRSLPPDLTEKVDNITRKALEIHEHVKCGLTSMDLTVYSVPHGTQFNGSEMDSDGPDGGKGKAKDSNWQENVICTLEMGLRYKKAVPSGNQMECRDETGIILKPKVVLADALPDYGITH